MTKLKFSRIKQALYIKLGVGGAWEQLCLQDGTIRVGFHEIPATLAQSQDTEAIRQIYLSRGVTRGTATRYAGELQKFYNAGTETLWFTISGGMLYWAVVDGPSKYLGSDRTVYPHGSTLRQTVSGWSNSSLSGKPLHVQYLSGRLTKVVGYRGTICTLAQQELNYLLRCLHDQETEEVTKAKEARSHLLSSCQALIRLLPWTDFELLADLIFTQSGWRRVGILGGSQKTADIELIQPMTKERAIVQVKSTTSAKELASYEKAFAEMAADRYFFVWHTCKDKLMPTSPNITIIGPQAMAEHVLNAGLYDWLIQKIS